MGVAREIELKLELDPSSARSFRQNASNSLGTGDGETRQLAAIYYDTRKRTLRRRGFSLRVRHDGERRIQTLKVENRAGAGLFDRPEWECDVSGEAPDPAAFAEGRAANVTAALGPLAAVFETRVARTTWIVEDGAAAIEIVVDEGTVSAGDVTTRIAEVELELKHGDAAALFRLARRLAASGRLRLAVRSKSERGYALLDGGVQAGIKAETVRLRRGMDAAEAFQAIARACIRHFRLNESALIETRAVESLHQARVAMRRLRSAFSLFRPVLADDEVEWIRRELQEVSRLLGEARNLDVFAARLGKDEPKRDGAAPTGSPPRVSPARVEADRVRAYDAVIRRLESKRFRLFMIDLAAWIEAGPWLQLDETALARGLPASEFADTLLDERWRKVRRKGRHLHRLAPEERHEVRIDAKKLRYACEFFGELTRRGKARRRREDLLKALEGLQTALGDLNDVATAQAMAARFALDGGDLDGVATPSDADEAPSRRPVGDNGKREAALLAQAVKAHRGISEAKPFWR